MPATDAKMLEELLATDSKDFRFNDWELEFITSLERLQKQNRNFTPKQQEMLRKLHHMAVIKGSRY